VLEKNMITLSFQHIEEILGFSLPASAYQHRPWWANSGHSQAYAWGRVGWKVQSVILGKNITFEKVNRNNR